MFSTILAPSHAPPELTDRKTLWNSVESVEKRYDAQLARRIVMALPKELPREEQIRLVQEFCQQQFVARGMIADIAIHDKGDGNPHAHILLTMRAMDEQGKWLPKSRMVYDLDEQGQKQKTARGSWKCHKQLTVDWNDHKYAEIWRHAWESIVNRYYAENERAERIDLRSYARQGIDQVPTVHMGPAVTQMERRSIRTNVGSLNRDISAYNSDRNWLRRTFLTIGAQLGALTAEYEEAAVQTFPHDQPRNLIQLLEAYHDIRADERKSWNRYAQRKSTIRDLQTLAQCVCWLQENNLSDLSDFQHHYAELRQNFQQTTEAIDEMEKERRSLEAWHKHLVNRKKYQTIYSQYAGKMFKSAKEKFADAHREELDKYRTAVRYFKAHPEREHTDPAELAAQRKHLNDSISIENGKLAILREQLQPYSQISYYLIQLHKPRPNQEEPTGREDQPFRSASQRKHEAAL